MPRATPNTGDARQWADPGHQAMRAHAVGLTRDTLSCRHDSSLSPRLCERVLGRDSDTTEPDLAMMEDSGPPVFCQTDYSLSSFSVPSLESGIGFNLDGGGSEIGCRDDGPGGVDNGVVGLDGLLGGFGFTLDQIIQLAGSVGALRFAARINECGASDTIELIDVNGQPIGAAAPITLEADGSFTAMIEEFPITMPLIIVPGTLDLTMERVQVGGTIEDGRIDDLVLGGAINGERVLALGQMIGPLAGIDPMLIDGVVRSLLDLDTDPDAGGCEQLSMQLTAVGVATAFQTAP